MKTVLCLLLHHTKLATCNLYIDILVKSTNQFTVYEQKRTCSLCPTIETMTRDRYYFT